MGPRGPRRVPSQQHLLTRGIEANLGGEHAGSFHRDLHKDLRADFILANPPFNSSAWGGGEHLRGDARWKFGRPPTGNANFTWVQHIIHHLAPNGLAGFVLASGSISSQQSGEGEIRKAIVRADLMDCMVALSGQLFYSTQIRVCLWFLARNKKNDRFRDRRGQTLFIKARTLGTLVDRTHRELTDEDIGKFAGHQFVLTPRRYLGAEKIEDDGEPFEEKMGRLVVTREEQFAEGKPQKWKCPQPGERGYLPLGKHAQVSVEGSSNRSNARRRLAKADVRVENIRRDALHKATTIVAENHSKVVIEGLRVRMGTRKSRGKRALNRVVLDTAFAEFRRFLEYKGRLYGCETVALPPLYTSQRCSVCGTLQVGNRVSQAEFRCLSRGYEINADFNAAINILAAGSCPDAQDACGGDVSHQHFGADAVARETGTIGERQIAGDLESRTLAALRDTLLPRLVTVEIRVPNPENLLEDSP